MGLQSWMFVSALWLSGLTGFIGCSLLIVGCHLALRQPEDVSRTPDSVEQGRVLVRLQEQFQFPPGQGHIVAIDGRKLLKQRGHLVTLYLGQGKIVRFALDPKPQTTSLNSILTGVSENPPGFLRLKIDGREVQGEVELQGRSFHIVPISGTDHLIYYF